MKTSIDVQIPSWFIGSRILRFVVLVVLYIMDILLIFDIIKELYLFSIDKHFNRVFLWYYSLWYFWGLLIRVIIKINTTFLKNCAKESAVSSVVRVRYYWIGDLSVRVGEKFL